MMLREPVVQYQIAYEKDKSLKTLFSVKKQFIELIKTFVKEIFVDIAGGLLIGFGIYNFAAQCGFPMAGISGIALILYHLFHYLLETQKEHISQNDMLK